MKNGKNALWMIVWSLGLAVGIPTLLAASGQIDVESGEGRAVAIVLFCVFLLAGVGSAIASARAGKPKQMPEPEGQTPEKATAPVQANPRQPGVLQGFIYPLTWRGSRQFIKTLVISFIPLIGLGAPAFAYPAGDKPVKGLMLKMVWLVIRMFFPSVALFLVCNEVIYRGTSLVLGYALMAALALSLLSSAVRLPMALAVAAAGGRIRDALKRGYVYKLIISSLGSYLLLLAGILPFAFLIALTDALTPWLALVCSFLITTWLRLYIGFGASVCHERASRNTHGKHPKSMPVKGVAASALAAVILITGLLPCCRVARAEQADVSSFVDDLKRTFSFESGRIPLLSTAWESLSDGFSRVSSAAGSGYNAAMERLGVLADIMPFISNANDLAEAHAYNQQWVDQSLSPEQREKARNLMILKSAQGLMPSKGALGWLGCVMTGADITVEKFKGGWDKAYDEWFGSAKNETDTVVIPANKEFRGVYACDTVCRDMYTGVKNNALMAHFRVSGQGRSLEVSPCFADGDYVRDYCVTVNYDESIGAYYGKNTRVKGNTSLTCEYFVNFGVDEKGYILNAEYNETVTGDGADYHLTYQFRNGRLIGSQGRVISRDQAGARDAELNVIQRETSLGGAAVGR